MPGPQEREMSAATKTNGRLDAVRRSAGEFIMSILRKASLVFVCGLILVSAGGCVVKRTVTEGGVVVGTGYVVKAPILE